ncbi:SpoIIE family protein phosphatase [Geodermatophilus sp. YIM 151500]|uniref:SpoIIE family protein phosphatase n=1 Tax=Geodermatophilus sp. YIM 151500 TaxID=2984531 RepID=UPI0021E4C508|nr:SpoIIE family protein phosphatase [Geodermatophilus sp. YIM 151500]MCV2488294.1 SpoIIE family protein phosphatase [Geodermatophilus sp. YIM 151500]
MTEWGSAPGGGSERALEAMPIGLIVVDTDWRVSYINSAGEAVVGYTRQQLVGMSYWEAFPANVDNEFGRTYREVAATGRPAMVEAFYPDPLNKWFEVRAVPGPAGLSLYFTEVTERRLAQERLALLARVGVELAATLDATAAAARIPGLVAPILSSWCALTLVRDDGTLRDIGSWHPDPEVRPLVQRYAAAAAHAPAPGSSVTRVLDSGSPVVETGGALTVPHDCDESVAAVLAELAPGTLTVLPVRGRDRTLGALSLGTNRLRPVAPGDVTTAQEVADRLGLALDNARLYDQQRRLAEELQRSLLTAPPESDVAEIAVRYLPAAEAARVGGDWYDSFLHPVGATAFVIGDVVGHDTAAAAAMGQLRSLLRGVAVATRAGPAGMLSALDAAITQLQMRTYATAAVACLSRDGDGRATLLWANAGHPTPLVLSADGGVCELGGGRGELMLGVDAAATRTDTETVLDPGATVLLYTDGLVERRTGHLDAGTAVLRAALHELRHLPLEQLCDALLDRLVEGRPEDDVALVALRVRS